MNSETTIIPTPVATPAPEELSVTLDVLARLLDYPREDFARKVEDTRKALRESGIGGGMSAFECFCATIAALSANELEELYTATFDVTPACVAYVSIHLFGEENFKRGEFMAALHARYEESGFDCRGELPDHISVLVRFAAAAGEEERRELVQFCLLGPLEKMITALAPHHPYRSLLETVGAVLRAPYPGMKPAISPVQQMRQEGAGCLAMTLGCGCHIGPEDDRLPAISLPTDAIKSRPFIAVPSDAKESHG